MPKAMAHSAKEGACEFEGVEVRFLWAKEAGPDDLLWADGLLIGTPENMGYMSGAIKDFLDRTYYPVEGKINNLPYSVFISAGNDGRGALSHIQRIGRGYPFKEVYEPVIARGELTDETLAKCRELSSQRHPGRAYVDPLDASRRWQCDISSD